MVDRGQMTGGNVLCYGLAERRAIVTGAGSGIGRACAALLARHGTAVALADLRGDAVDRVADEITADGGRAIGIACDVGDEESVAGAVTGAAAEFGGLDTVVAAVGIARPGRATDLTLAEVATMTTVCEGKRGTAPATAQVAWWRGHRNRAVGGPGDRRGEVCGSCSTGGCRRRTGRTR